MKTEKNRKKLDRTIKSVNKLMADLYFLLNRSSKTQSQRNQIRENLEVNALQKIRPNAKALKEILLEAGIDRKKELEEEMGRKRELIIHTVPESKVLDTSEGSSHFCRIARSVFAAFGRKILQSST